jgi:hypothetical protein
MENNLRSKIEKKEEINNIGIMYHLMHLDCNKKYVRQTGRNFKTGYKEHINDIRESKINAGYSLYIYIYIYIYIYQKLNFPTE